MTEGSIVHGVDSKLVGAAGLSNRVSGLCTYWVKTGDAGGQELQLALYRTLYSSVDRTVPSPRVRRVTLTQSVDVDIT